MGSSLFSSKAEGESIEAGEVAEEAVSPRIEAGARTLETVARFTVHPSGQIIHSRRTLETPSILTAYGCSRDRFLCDV